MRGSNDIVGLTSVGLDVDSHGHHAVGGCSLWVCSDQLQSERRPQSDLYWPLDREEGP
jgi:hypothetical protein